jgi:hypothetical protein
MVDALVVVTVVFVAAIVGWTTDHILFVVAVPAAAVLESVNVSAGTLKTAPLSPLTVLEKLPPSHMLRATPIPPELIMLPVVEEVATVVPENVIAPLKVWAPAVITKDAAPPASGMVYTLEAAGAGAVIVMVFVVPRTNWFVVADTVIWVFVVNVVPVSEMAPDVDVRFREPVVSTRPFDAVKVPEDVSPPAIVCAEPNVDKIKLAAPPASGMVYVLETAGAVALIVVVFVVPNLS